MVNLLSRPALPDPFPALGPADWQRLCDRARGCIAIGQSGDAKGRDDWLRALEVFEEESEELEQAPLLANAASLVDGVDRLRARSLEGRGPEDAPVVRGDAFDLEGELFCYRPGRSLGTGEAEIASRGYLDVSDRPPLWSWVWALGRRVNDRDEGFEVGVLAWVSPLDAARVRDGALASATRSILPLDEISPLIAAQWKSQQEQAKSS